MSKRINQPSIRFRNSNTKWRTWKIGDVLTEKYRPIFIEDEKEYQLVTVKRRTEGVVSREYLKGKNILVKNYFEVEEGDFIISKRQIIHGASGIVPKSLHKAVVSNEYFVACSNDNISSEYLTLISKLPDMHKLFFLSSYGVDIEKMVFDVGDWKKRSITIPESNEQKIIADFFQDIDKLITQHQRKHEKLTALKQAMLDKMFPKQGRLVPEIRFKGFEGQWEEKSLESEVDFFTGLTYSPLDVVKDKGTFVIRSSNIKDGKLVSADNVFVNTSKVNCEFVKENDIAVVVRNGSRDLIGKHAQLKSAFDNTVVGAFMTGTRSAVPNFINALLDTKQFKNEINKNLGATINQITAGNFKAMKFPFPKKEEQKLIGDYFENIDNLIANHETQITKLQNLKKAFFAKMFI